MQLALAPVAFAQDGDLLLHDETYLLLDRLDIKGWVRDSSIRGIATERRPIPREWAAQWLARVDSQQLGRRDRAWLQRTRIRLDDAVAPWRTGPDDAWYTRGLFTDLFRNRRDLVAIRDGKFRLYANPIVAASIGTERLTGGVSNSVWRRTVGASVRGQFGSKLGYYADLMTTQVQLPQFQDDYVRANGAVPGAPFWKPFGTGGYDFFEWRGYLTYTPAEFLRIKFGHDRSAFGNGMQSLLLSDVATDYLLLSLTWRFWKLEYTSHFAQLTDFIPNKPDRQGSYPRKYGAFHVLTYRPIPQVSVSVYEAVLTDPRDRGFELQYLNPLIFFRAVEQAVGSPDNSLLGLMVKANLWKRFQLSGQLMIDDYNFGARRDGSGWWGNKTGVQLAGKYIDVLGVETLDLQLEYNTIRPYAYGHFNVVTNFTHYGQLLAHPMGANLNEVSVAVNYQPIPRLYLYARAMRVEQGRDENGINYGADPFRADAPVPGRSFGNITGQGLSEQLTVLQGRATYQLWNSGLYFDLEGMYRQSSLATTGDALILQAGLRLNLPNRPALF